MHVLVYISANISSAPSWMFQKPYLTVFVADNSIGQVLFYHAQALIHSNCCCGFSSGSTTSSTYLLYYVKLNCPSLALAKPKHQLLVTSSSPATSNQLWLGWIFWILSSRDAWSCHRVKDYLFSSISFFT